MGKVKLFFNIAGLFRKVVSSVATLGRVRGRKLHLKINFCSVFWPCRCHCFKSLLFRKVAFNWFAVDI